MYIVVTYDISDDHRRNKVAKCMEDYGTRVQWSVFDCLINEKELNDIKNKLFEIIDPETDSIRFYRLCKRCRNTIEIIGVGTVKEKQDLVII